MGVRDKLKRENNSLPMLQRYELLERLKQLGTMRDRALGSFLYLTGCRIEEVVRYKSYKYDKKGQAIKKKQVSQLEDRIMVYGVRVLKRKDGVIKNMVIRRNSLDKPFIELLEPYLLTLDPEDCLFDMCRQRAYQILEEVDLYPHYLRHLRTTHLVIDFNFSGEHLKNFHAWASSRMAEEYVHLNTTDIFEKMK